MQIRKTKQSVRKEAIFSNTTNDTYVYNENKHSHV